jgi:ABC-type Fe3+/spermidine/putrescine transport system ATPase subunit
LGIRLENVRKRYPDFLLELDFEARQGELLTLLGPSGCGKTTTLRLIAGFIRQDRGRLIVDGRTIDDLPPHRRRIGVVFQDYALFPHLNVRDNVGFGLRMHGWAPARARRRIEELLRLVALEGYARRKVDQLSGGEQQRVALARALAPQPQLLLLDEPLSALDAKLRKNLRGEILRVQRELAITTIYVTHDQEEALVLGDRIAVMRNGHIEQIDTPERIYDRPQNLFVAAFLGQANLIRGRLQSRDGDFALVNTSLGLLRVTRPEGWREKPGQRLIVFFRPEHCRLRSARHNRIRGRILRREYLGSHRLIEIDSGGEHLTLDLTESQSLACGEEITFSVDPRNCRLFLDSE